MSYFLYRISSFLIIINIITFISCQAGLDDDIEMQKNTNIPMVYIQPSYAIPQQQYNIPLDSENENVKNAIIIRPKRSEYDSLKLTICDFFVKTTPIALGGLLGFYFMTNNGEDPLEAYEQTIQAVPEILGILGGFIVGNITSSALQWKIRQNQKN